MSKALATAAPSRTQERFWVDVPFVAHKAPAGASAKAGDLVLVGYASTWLEDRDGEYVDPEAFSNSLPLYLAKNPMLLWQHNHDWPLGQVTKAAVDETGLSVEAWVRKPNPGEEPWKFSAYYDIKSGIVKTFSIGGLFTRDIRAGKPVIIEIDLWELSCVSVPSNTDSIYAAAVKAIKGEHRPGLHQKAIDQMAQVLGLAAVSDPEIARMQPAERQARYELLADLYKRAGKQAPAFAEWQTVAKRVLERDSNAGANALVDAREVINVAKAVYGLVPSESGSKAGRVLSKANENVLQAARDTIIAAADKLDGVLAAVRKEDPEEPKAAKAPGDLIWGPEDSFQDLRDDIAEQLNVPGQWRYDVIDINLAADMALVCDWQANEYWVVPFTVNGDGEPEVELAGSWVEAERGWVEAAADAGARAAPSNGKVRA